MSTEYQRKRMAEMKHDEGVDDLHKEHEIAVAQRDESLEIGGVTRLAPVEQLRSDINMQQLDINARAETVALQESRSIWKWKAARGKKALRDLKPKTRSEELARRLDGILPRLTVSDDGRDAGGFAAASEAVCHSAVSDLGENGWSALVERISNEKEREPTYMSDIVDSIVSEATSAASAVTGRSDEEPAAETTVLQSAGEYYKLSECARIQQMLSEVTRSGRITSEQALGLIKRWHTLDIPDATGADRYLSESMSSRPDVAAVFLSQAVSTALYTKLSDRQNRLSDESAPSASRQKTKKSSGKASKSGEESEADKLADAVDRAYAAMTAASTVANSLRINQDFERSFKTLPNGKVISSDELEFRRHYISTGTRRGGQQRYDWVLAGLEDDVMATLGDDMPGDDEFIRRVEAMQQSAARKFGQIDELLKTAGLNDECTAMRSDDIREAAVRRVAKRIGAGMFKDDPVNPELLSRKIMEELHSETTAANKKYAERLSVCKDVRIQGIPGLQKLLPQLIPEILSWSDDEAHDKWNGIIKTGLVNYSYIHRYTNSSGGGMMLADRVFVKLGLDAYHKSSSEIADQTAFALMETESELMHDPAYLEAKRRNKAAYFKDHLSELPDDTAVVGIVRDKMVKGIVSNYVEMNTSLALLREKGITKSIFGGVDPERVMASFDAYLMKYKPHGVSSRYELAKLSPAEGAGIVSHAFANVKLYSSTWIESSGSLSTADWQEVSSEMFAGQLSRAEFALMIDEKLKAREREAADDEYRAKSALLTEPVYRGTPVYSYLRSQSHSTDMSRGFRRRERFRNAREVTGEVPTLPSLYEYAVGRPDLHKIAEKDLPAKFGELGKKYLDFVSEQLKTTIPDEKQRKKEYERVKSVLYERGLEEYDDLVFEKLGGDVTELANAKYSKRIFELGLRAEQRKASFQSGGRGSYAESAKQNLRRQLIMLDDGAEGNVETYGVSSFEQYVTYLGEITSMASQSYKAGSFADVKQKRVEQLGDIHGGALRPLLPILMSERSSDRAFTTMTDDDYLKWLDELSTKALPAMDAMRSRYGEHEGMTDQLVLEYGRDIIAGRVATRADAIKLYDDLYGKICDTKLGRKTVSERVADALKKVARGKSSSDAASRYILNIVMAYDPSEIADDKRFDEICERINAQVKANEALLEKYIAASGFDERYGSGFRMFCSSEVFSCEPEEFQEKLAILSKDFSKLDENKVSETLKTREKLKARVKLYSDIQGHLIENKELLDKPSVDAEKRRAEREEASVKEAAAKDYLTKNLPIELADTDIIDVLTSRLPELCGTDFELNREKIGKLTLNVSSARDIIRDVEIDGKKIPQSLAPEFLDYYSARLVGSIEDGGSKPDEEDVKAAYSEYLDSLKEINELRDLGGAVQDDEFLARRRRDMLFTLSHDMFTVSRSTFAQRVESSIKELKAFISGTKMIEQIVSDKKIEQRYFRAAVTALRAYCSRMLIEYSGDEESLKAFLTSNVDNSELMDILIHGDRLDSVGPDSDPKAPLEDAESQKEYAFTLSENMSEKQSAAFNSLTSAERQYFALMLCTPGVLKKDPGFPRDRRVKAIAGLDDELVHAETVTSDFTFRGAITEKPDYVTAQNQLMRTGKFDSELFDLALERTLQVSEERENSMRRRRVEDSVQYCGDSIKLMRGSAEAAKVSEEADQIKLRKKSLPVAMKELAEAEGSQADVAFINNLDPISLRIFATLLSNRTTLDKSDTVMPRDRITGKTVDGVQNEAARRELKRLFVNSPITALGGQLSPNLLSDAFVGAMSYRITDAQSIDENGLLRSQITGSERKTRVDWEMVRKAEALTDEIYKTMLGRQTAKSASAIAPYSDCKPAVKLLAEQKTFFDTLETQKLKPAEKIHQSMLHIDDMIKSNAVADGHIAELAGYSKLTEPQKALFFRALSDRTILDVSKQDMLRDVFGLSDRDFVDPVSRDALTSEYMFSGSYHTRLNDLSAGVVSLLSVQLADNPHDGLADFDRASAQVSRLGMEKLRTTAVDWKLFSRALQFVFRADEELKFRHSIDSIDVMTGDIRAGSDFECGEAFFRRNLHTAGNSLTRSIGSALRPIQKLPDHKPDTVKIPLSKDNVASITSFLSEAGYLAHDQSRMAAALRDVASSRKLAEGILDVDKRYAALSGGKDVGNKLEFVSKALGFENVSEAIDFSRSCLVRILLFCSGPHCGDEQLSSMSSALLRSIGAENAAGHLDSETSAAVYARLF